MRTRDRVSQLILIFAALASAAWAIRNLLEVREPFSGSAGIGAVSIGISEAVLESVPILVVIGLLVSRRVVTAARRHSRLADRFRRAYLWWMAAYLFWGVVTIAFFTLAQGQGIATFYVTIMSGHIVAATFLPLQAFFAAAAAAFMIGHPTTSAPAE